MSRAASHPKLSARDGEDFPAPGLEQRAATGGHVPGARHVLTRHPQLRIGQSEDALALSATAASELSGKTFMTGYNR